MLTATFSRRDSYQHIHDKNDGQVRGEEAHTAVFAFHAHDGLADKRQVDETTIRIAEGETKKLRH